MEWIWLEIFIAIFIVTIIIAIKVFVNHDRSDYKDGGGLHLYLYF